MIAGLSGKLTSLLNRAKAGDAVVIGVGAAVVLGLGWALWPASDPRPSDLKKEQAAVATTVHAGGADVAVTRIGHKDVAKAAATLAAGNRADPLLAAVGSPKLTDASREKALSWMYTVLLKSTIPAAAGAAPVQTASGDAVAVWFPNGGDVSFCTMFFHGAWQYMARFSGWGRRGRWPGYGEVCRARRARLMAGQKFYYLLTAAGSATGLEAVIKAGTSAADAAGAACYAEATNASLKAALAGAGFTEAETFTLFGVAVSIMKRAAASP